MVTLCELPKYISIPVAIHCQVSQFYLSNCGMGGRIARPGQRFSDAGPLTLLAALSTGKPRDPRPQPLRTTPAHPRHPHLIFLFLRLPPEAAFDSSSSRPKMDPSEVCSKRGPPSPAAGRGRTGYNRKERSSNVAACLTPILRRPVTPGLSSLPSSSTQCLSSHLASTPRWRPTMSRAKTPKPS